MFGQGSDEDRGIIPRAMEELFQQLDRRSQDKEIAVVISFLEIYCDQIRYYVTLLLFFILCNMMNVSWSITSELCANCAV
jgi:hypothetical protein